ncbi:FadR family transcriptional regulator [Caenimonas sedimenti]|uniref:FadR family transcriptional regulator n=1 Tax=Caenimonas sedimenti TaxID=2596921 RepID=A0A562ZET5_9BURK|nr:FadR/GntR family transcriptional regulator [Caenimonas sedimenti]TWO66044.1 FadR family transcriptional regulator [Caenimonas sedimenti]
MSAPKPPDPRRLYQQIADQIKELIAKGTFQVGDRLPAERELALLLGVSRPSLREGLIALDVQGNIEIRGGSGVYVCPQPEARAAKATPELGESPHELMQARSAVESAVMILACALGTKEQLKQLRAIVTRMREETERNRAPLELDRQFHMTLADMSGNSVMARIIAQLFDERHSPISAKLSSKYETPRTWKQALKEHEAILRALEARDPIAAQAAMLSHLRASELRWVGD